MRRGGAGACWATVAASMIASRVTCSVATGLILYHHKRVGATVARSRMSELEAGVKSETDTLLVVTARLLRDGWNLRQVSPSPWSQRERVEHELMRLGVAAGWVRFQPRGVDIEAERDGVIWRVECKGAGDGKQQTLRNNFDRALASVVSYYDPPAGSSLQLGLALADHRDYRWQVQTRVPPALRQALNLWLLLVMADGDVKVCAPEGELSAAWPRVARRGRAAWREVLEPD